jgi:ATP-dependent RNA helicase DeaD
MKIMVTFNELGIGDKLVKAVEDMGWTEPTPVQVSAVPAGLNGRDVFAQAQTGTGKTGAYALPVMGRITTGGRIPAAIILAPTRELAVQIDAEIYKLSKYTNHRSVAIYGGASISDQIYKLKRGTDIIVGTPGRVKDMIERKELILSEISEVVLDEADRMLDMGFAEELDFIMDKVPKERQTLLFSATMSREIKQMSMRFMVDPLEILVSRDEPCSDLTAQYYVQVSRGGKHEKLDFVVSNGNPKTIVFCQTKKMVDELFDDLSDKYKVGAIHGDLRQNQREKVIRNFRSDRIQILIATDVAARGLDVNNVDLVINYDVPVDSETYLHRIGRTGRAGKEGIAISFVTKMEDRRVGMYERAVGKRIGRVRVEEMPPIEHVFSEVAFEEESPRKRERKAERSSRSDRYSERSSGRSSDRYSERSSDRPEKSGDREVRGDRETREYPPKTVTRAEKFFAESKAEGRFEKPERSSERSEAVSDRPVVREAIPKEKKSRSRETVVLQINLGRDDGVGRAHIQEFVLDNSTLADGTVGRIGLGNSSSYFEIPENKAEAAIDSITGRTYGQKKVFVQIAPKKVPYNESDCRKVTRAAGTFKSSDENTE